jgi:hypothetical protein
MITIKATGDTTLYTAGKYCEEDILVKVPEGSGGESTPTQEKTINITKNGTTEITPDDGYALSKVTANVKVPIPDDYIKPSGTLLIDENGTHNVAEYASVEVSVPSEAPNIQPLDIIENGTYTASDGVDGYSPITVNVSIPEPKLQNKTVTPNEEIQTIIADGGYDGLNRVMVFPIPSEYIIPSGVKDIAANGQYDVTDKASVSVNVPIPDGYIQPSGELEITENGQYNVTEKASVNVVVPEREIVLQEKTVTENGEVIPDSGYDGLSKVVVNVPTGGSGGGEDLEAVLTEQEEIIAELTEELQKKTSGEPNLGTCTVVIDVPSKTNYYICCEAVSGDTITYNVTKHYVDADITKSVRCDSVMYIVAGTIEGAEVTDGEILKLVSGQALVYKTPSLNNSIVQITLIG